MLRANQQKIEEKKLKDKAGFDSNESRFGGYGDELREKKILTVPGLGRSSLKIWQGWNEKARQRDVLKLTISDIDQELSVFISRKELEQAMMYFAWGDTIIKYVNPKFTNPKKPSQVQWEEWDKKF